MFFRRALAPAVSHRRAAGSRLSWRIGQGGTNGAAHLPWRAVPGSAGVETCWSSRCVLHRTETCLQLLCEKTHIERQDTSQEPDRH
jgi:hypothetical protein